MRARVFAALASGLAMFALSPSDTFAQSKYDIGANDREIKIGNILAYSGPVSSLGIIGKIEAAYFQKINDEGGVNGRRSISFRMTTLTAHQRLLSRLAGSSRATRCS